MVSEEVTRLIKAKKDRDNRSEAIIKRQLNLLKQVHALKYHRKEGSGILKGAHCLCRRRQQRLQKTVLHQLVTSINEMYFTYSRGDLRDKVEKIIPTSFLIACRTFKQGMLDVLRSIKGARSEYPVHDESPTGQCAQVCNFTVGDDLVRHQYEMYHGLGETANIP